MDEGTEVPESASLFDKPKSFEDYVIWEYRGTGRCSTSLPHCGVGLNISEGKEKCPT